MSNDSMAGTGSSIGGHRPEERTGHDEGSTAAWLARCLVPELPESQHGWLAHSRMRAGLVFLFRLLKVDTVLVYDPSALYERNPDHYVTARAVESACWMAGSEWDYTEHLKAGLTLHAPRDKYDRAGTAAGKSRGRYRALHGQESLCKSREPSRRDRPGTPAPRCGPSWPRETEDSIVGQRWRDGKSAVHPAVRAQPRSRSRTGPQTRIRRILPLLAAR
jgi:hypothetical protein